MPITATLAMVAAASMAGVPLLNGFLSKEMFFAETVFVSGHASRVSACRVLAVIWGIFSVAYSLRFILQVFFGPPATDLPRKPHEPPRWMLLPSALLVMACLVVGMFPAETIGPFLDTAARSVLGADMPSYSLAVWHGLNLPLVMSLVAMVGGTMLYLALGKYQQGAAVVPLINRFDGRRLFEFAIQKLRCVGGVADAVAFDRTFASPVAAPDLRGVRQCIDPPCTRGCRRAIWPASAFQPAFALLWLVGAACAIGAATQAKYHRLAALSLAGAAGLATAMTFVWFSAPDLALTQLVVEVVTVVLILLGLRWLPPRYAWIDDALDSFGARVRARSRRLRDLALASIAGAGMAHVELCGTDAAGWKRNLPFLHRKFRCRWAAAPT